MVLADEYSLIAATIKVVRSHMAQHNDWRATLPAATQAADWTAFAKAV